MLSPLIVSLPRWIESPQLKRTSPTKVLQQLMTMTWIGNFIIFWSLHPDAGVTLKQPLLWFSEKASSFPYLTWNGDPQGIPWILYNTWPILYIYSKGRLLRNIYSCHCFPFRQNQLKFFGFSLSALDSLDPEYWSESLTTSGRSLLLPHQFRPTPLMTLTSLLWPYALRGIPTLLSTMILFKLGMKLCLKKKETH